MLRILWVVAGLAAVVAAFLLWFFLSYGGSGTAFPKMGDVRPQHQAEIVAVLHEPPGNLAVSRTGRLFFTYHAESRPEIKVLELVDGKPVPYPNLAMQTSDSDTPSYGAVFNIRIDGKDRLWSIDHGQHGVLGARLVAVDTHTNRPIRQIKLPKAVAGIGSYLQDMQIDPAARMIYIADLGAFSKHPGLVIVDSETGRARRVLDRHPALMPEAVNVVAQGRLMKPLGLFWFHPGFDPIALDRRGEWLYIGPMSGRTLSRVRVADLLDERLSADQLAAKVEAYAQRPQADGLTIDNQDNIYLTGIEDGIVWKLGADRKLVAFAGHPRMRWPDGLSFGPDNMIYIADSDIPDVMMQSKTHIAAAGPFYIFRVRADGSASAGQ